MSVLSRSALEASPLADLHAIAGELGLDGFRRLRKAELIDQILATTGGDSAPAPTGDDAEATERPRRRRSTSSRDAEDEEAAAAPSRRGRRSARSSDDEAEPARRASRSRDGDDEDEAPSRRPSRSRSRSRFEEDADDAERSADGVVEVLGNGSGFLRLGEGGEPSDDDVYVSAAQVRRCELVSGDRVTGPVRAPRRSERYASLVRVDTINGQAADEVAGGARFEDLPAAFPSERFALDAEDPTLKAIEWLTPLGRGSRATIVGGARAGKSEALRRLAGALKGVDGIELSVVLLGARPEELAEWREIAEEPAAALTLGTSADAQAQALERAVDAAKRVAARGGDAVVLVDSLEGVPAQSARRALAAARNIVDGGSLSVIAAAPAPLGGETTVVALDGAMTAAGRFPALDLAASGTLRPELLVGDAGAQAIADARAS